MRATRFSACECVRTSARARLGGCLLLPKKPCSGLYIGPPSAACAAAATGLLLRLLLQTSKRRCFCRKARNTHRSGQEVAAEDADEAGVGGSWAWCQAGKL